jgi:hypothetical protein
MTCPSKDRLSRCSVSSRTQLKCPFSVQDYANHLHQLDLDVRHDLELIRLESVPNVRFSFYEAGFGRTNTDKAFPDALIEIAVWGDVINRTQSCISAVDLSKWSAGPKGNFRAFYNGSLADFIAFKDECRNLLMHTRHGLYNPLEALNWRSRVCTCMHRLAEKIDQDTTALLLSESDWK